MAESICTVPFNLSESRTVKCTSQWFVDESEYDALECTYELLICGEEAFGAVYEAIKNARTSVLIACWGFQPSMYFVKHGRAQSLRSTVYGDDSCLAIGQLLEKKAHEGVKVRLLCWADRVLGSNISLVPISGEVNTQGMGSITGNSRNFGATEEQYAYDKDFFDAYVSNICMGGNPSNWFRRTFLERGKENAFGKKANLLENLKLRLRGFGPADRLEALWGHGEHASAAARALYAAAASHHQKMVLVDYEDPENHVGFVMGHNMLDEYWDTRAHSYYRKAPWEGRNGLLPREDVSARITGPYHRPLRGQSILQLQDGLGDEPRRSGDRVSRRGGRRGGRHDSRHGQCFAGQA